ncbi:HDL062Wp [Eremothecium sinecaudum]|uniref:Kinesin-like protein n=1 Tax=Eremothecium sinecaudum TaxID=45286 RepID=A0A0X8HSJ6_9SACH|nr:HDL062Wp [Eremothecium sinecaudum]AMD20682.1 HDL062Wp [Eremothecium sinecaudum]
MSVPTTPSKRGDYSYPCSSPSLIPSPRNTLRSPKYQPRSEDIDDNRIKVLNPVDTNQLSRHTKPQHKESRSHHMTHFYHDNIKQLSYLQDELMLKKQKLDLLRDEMLCTRSKVEMLQLKVDRLKEEKRAKEQQILLKENELNCLKDDSETKKKFMIQGHDLQLQQVRTNKEAKLNTMESGYRSKCEELKFKKLQKYQAEKDNLIGSISELNANIEDNEKQVQKMLQESEARHRETKELWLRNFQDDWKHLIGKKDAVSEALSVLAQRIKEELEPELQQEKDSLKSLKSTLAEIVKRVSKQKTISLQKQDEIIVYTKEIQKSQRQRLKLNEQIETSQTEIEEIKEILNKEESMRRKLHNELQELRGNIRVYCRIRPPLPCESGDVSHFNIEKFNEVKGQQTLTITREACRSSSHSFHFDKIFSPETSNSEVFQEICQLVQSSLDGYNVCIFAYGQTGSGKTYTMLNPGDGIIPLTLSHIFKWTTDLIERSWEYEMECEYVEIYNEAILDLLRDYHNPDSTDELLESQKHEIRHNHERQETYITNITKVRMTSREQVDSLLRGAARMRSTASTRSNERSSRSHSVFTVHIKGHNTQSDELTHGRLNLVDLAGSERINSSLVVGDRLRETQNINKSLSCLGDVIYALNSPEGTKRHIPFRNSKLTYLLQYSLIGDSKTLMFVNIPSDLHHINETLNSLRFASKVNSTKMKKA